MLPTHERTHSHIKLKKSMNSETRICHRTVFLRLHCRKYVVQMTIIVRNLRLLDLSAYVWAPPFSFLCLGWWIKLQSRHRYKFSAQCFHYAALLLLLLLLQFDIDKWLVKVLNDKNSKGEMCMCVCAFVWNSKRKVTLTGKTGIQ